MEQVMELLLFLPHLHEYIFYNVFHMIAAAGELFRKGAEGCIVFPEYERERILFSFVKLLQQFLVIVWLVDRQQCYENVMSAILPKKNHESLNFIIIRLNLISSDPSPCASFVS